MSKALIIIDIKNEYFENGALALKDPIPASENAKKLLNFFRSNNLPLVHVQHVSPAGAPFFVADTKGVEIHEHVKPIEGEKVITKQYPNSFRDTGLMEYLKSQGVTHLVIAGMMTHMCIDAGTRAAFDLGFECTVIADACATMDLEIAGHQIQATDVHHAFLAALEFFYAKIRNTDEYLNG